MKLAMAQMKTEASIQENLKKSLFLMEQAKRAGADLILFPEIQLSPFFPQYRKQNADRYLVQLDGPEITALQEQCRKLGLWASPNVYLLQNGSRYDASLLIDADGAIVGISKMVHITQAEHFYEQDYYTPSEEGFPVYDTPFGKIGIVICFDRHIPASIRSCAEQGAQLVLIPTANLTEEPMKLFEWEVRVQSFQNTLFAAMCNRVGPEGEVIFSGASLAAGPDGALLCKAGDAEELLLADLPLEQTQAVRAERPWLQFQCNQVRSNV